MHKSMMALAVLVMPVTAHAHSGGTDANGCHTNHQTGDYHCHNPKARSQAAAPVKAKAPAVRAPKLADKETKVERPL